MKNLEELKILLKIKQYTTNFNERLELIIKGSSLEELKEINKFLTS